MTALALSSLALLICLVLCVVIRRLHRDLTQLRQAATADITVLHQASQHNSLAIRYISEQVAQQVAPPPNLTLH